MVRQLISGGHCHVLQVGALKREVDYVVSAVRDAWLLIRLLYGTMKLSCRRKLLSVGVQLEPPRRLKAALTSRRATGHLTVGDLVPAGDLIPTLLVRSRFTATTRRRNCVVKPREWFTSSSSRDYWRLHWGPPYYCTPSLYALRPSPAKSLEKLT